MVKSTFSYVCQSCGFASVNWFGKCPQCREWGTFVEESREAEGIDFARVKDIEPQSLKYKSDIGYERIKTGIDEFDRTLGGGAVRGSLILLGGDPGIGKSTLLLQVAGSSAKSKVCSIYVCGEESLQQTRLRADRINVISDDVLLICETTLEVVLKCLSKHKPDIVVIDSIQVMYSNALSSSPGSVGQVRYCASQLMRFAKNNNITIFLVGHITKSGMIAGPKVLEHLVDTVLYFEGGKQHSYRVIRAVKNRFGSTDEVAIFNMTEKGLIEVNDPSELFLSERKPDIPGSVVVPCIEGTRPLLIEIQALVTPAYGVPKRRATGYDINRLMLLLAVLEKRCSCRFYSQDVFINIAGGVKVSEPSADLAVCIALVSALKDVPVNHRVVALGEVGLGGETRSVSNTKKRLKEASRLGFTMSLVPKGNLKECKAVKIETVGVSMLSEAIDKLL